MADEQSEFDKDVAIAEQKLANFEPEIPQRKPGRTGSATPAPYCEDLVPG